MRGNEDITRAVELFADTVLRVCAVYFRDRHDREDAFQDTFLRYAQSETEFNDDEHRKAWLIRVATNVCKDQLKRASAQNLPLSAIDAEAIADGRPGTGQPGASLELIDALQRLDYQYRMVLFLKYYEDCTAAEIATLLDMPENTVYTNLARGREKLKEVLACEERKSA